MKHVRRGTVTILVPDELLWEKNKTNLLLLMQIAGSMDIKPILFVTQVRVNIWNTVSI